MKLKRWAPKDALTPSEMLLTLRQLRLRALAQHSSVWLSVTAAEGAVLERCCVGQREGGPGTAVEVAVALGQDPQLHTQPVRLSLEEAFLLVHALGCLSVHLPAAGGDDGDRGAELEPITEETLWRWCVAVDDAFVYAYVALHHFRAKGWVARSGLLYGADLVLYQRHPAAVHSSFGVIVIPTDGPRTLQLSWHDLAISQRLLNQVSKSLLLLHVCEEPDADHSSCSAFLAGIKVEERLVERWVVDSFQAPPRQLV